MADIDISRVPPNVNLELYAGDGVAIKFTLKDSTGTAYALDGAVTAQIRTKRTDPDPIVSWTVDTTDGADGIVIVSLTGAQTASLIASGKTSFSGAWDMQYVASGAEPLTLLQGSVTCDADVTH
jgi:hypothetical protein